MQMLTSSYQNFPDTGANGVLQFCSLPVGMNPVISLPVCHTDDILCGAYISHEHLTHSILPLPTHTKQKERVNQWLVPPESTCCSSVLCDIIWVKKEDVSAIPAPKDCHSGRVRTRPRICKCIFYFKIQQLKTEKDTANVFPLHTFKLLKGNASWVD